MPGRATELREIAVQTNAMKPSLEIVVSSCDAYEDCWEPFFKLFDIYWPECHFPITLITEKKTYSGPYCKVTSFPVARVLGRNSVPWGRRLMECLGRSTAGVVLYLQEDFFLEDQVEEPLIDEFMQYIITPSWTHQRTMQIGLCPRSSHGPFHLTEHPLLWEVDTQARYRFSLLPGLWSRTGLLRYLCPGHTGWEFEETSHIRARRTRERILTVNRHVFRLDGRQVYPFDPSGGIVHGKWARHHVPDLFARHDIKVDFGLRGFYQATEAATAGQSTPGRWKSRLRRWLRGRYYRIHALLNEPIDRFRY